MESPSTYKSEQKAKLLAVDKIVKQQAKIMTFLQDQLAWVQDKQTQFANWDCQPHLEYWIDDEVYVNARYFASEISKKLLDLKNAGSWKINRIIDNKVYEKEIPQHMKDASLTPIFHLWKLHLASNNLFPDQVLLPESLISIQNNNDDNIYNKWEMLDIIDCCKTKKYRTQYKVTYIGNWKEWNAAPAWQP